MKHSTHKTIIYSYAGTTLIRLTRPPPPALFVTITNAMQTIAFLWAMTFGCPLYHVWPLFGIYVIQFLFKQLILPVQSNLFCQRRCQFVARSCCLASPLYWQLHRSSSTSRYLSTCHLILLTMHFSFLHLRSSFTIPTSILQAVPLILFPM